MVRPDVVAAKVGRARAWLNDAALSLLGQQEVYLADPQRRDLALFYPRVPGGNHDGRGRVIPSHPSASATPGRRIAPERHRPPGRQGDAR